MKYELDPVFVGEVAAAVVKCLDEMSGSGTTAEQRQQLVVVTINRINDPPPELQTVTAEDVGVITADTLGINVLENVKGHDHFGG